MNPWAVLGLGLVLGIRHAMDPDHVVAVAAMTARERRLLPAIGLGALWGVGHTLTLSAAGAAIILFNLTLPPRLGLAFEFVVALALVVVGALNLGRGVRTDQAAHTPHAPAFRAFGVGLAHGLAGSAAVALLVLATVREPRLACGYLLVFGAGTIAGMVLVTTGFAAPLALAAGRWPRFGSGVRLATGALSLALGAWLMVHIGFVDGLFLGQAHWSPH